MINDKNPVTYVKEKQKVKDIILSPVKKNADSHGKNQYIQDLTPEKRIKQLPMIRNIQ